MKARRKSAVTGNKNGREEGGVFDAGKRFEGLRRFSSDASLIGISARTNHVGGAIVLPRSDDPTG